MQPNMNTTVELGIVGLTGNNPDSKPQQQHTLLADIVKGKLQELSYMHIIAKNSKSLTKNPKPTFKGTETTSRYCSEIYFIKFVTILNILCLARNQNQF